MTESLSHRKLITRALTILALTGFIGVGCDVDRSDLMAPEGRAVLQDALNAAIAIQNRHTPDLLSLPGVVGTGVGLGADGRPVITVFTERAGVGGLPAHLDGLPIAVKETGMFIARSDPTAKFPRPVPTGVSTGHPAITAGTIGARVTKAGQVFALSNNHVYANQNNASIGDNILQPGPFDGGQNPGDKIGTLHDFEPIDFSIGGSNIMDAAIALSSVAELGNATPEDGYGTPSPTTVSASVGLKVQKFGRTTKLTKGEVSEINVTAEICYEVWIIWCVKSAIFVNQIAVTPGIFSDGGDSGSLIVTDDQNKNPVGLLFAGSSSHTLANPIGPVLARFGVTIDAAAPAPLTDVAVTSVSAPGSATKGDAVNVDVTVQNVGNQYVGSDIEVTLNDDTDGAPIGTQTIVGGLAAGVSTTLTYSWNTQGASLGDHTLTAAHDFSDENAANNSKSTTVTVSDSPPPPTGMHVGDLFPYNSSEGRTWSAYVIVRIEDSEHNPVVGATVFGSWTGKGLAVDQCETDYAGECLMLSTLLKTKKVTFTVTNVVFPGLTYESSANHDADGDSNGTSITINKP